MTCTKETTAKTTWKEKDLPFYGSTYCIAAKGLHPDTPAAKPDNEYTHNWTAAVTRAQETGRFVYVTDVDADAVYRPGTRTQPGTVAIFFCCRCEIRQRIWSYNPGEFTAGFKLNRTCPGGCGSDQFQFEEYL